MQDSVVQIFVTASRSPEDEAPQQPSWADPKNASGLESDAGHSSLWRLRLAAISAKETVKTPRSPILCFRPMSFVHITRKIQPPLSRPPHRPVRAHQREAIHCSVFMIRLSPKPDSLRPDAPASGQPISHGVGKQRPNRGRVECS